MVTLVLAGLFGVAGLVLATAALTGRRGQVCQRGVGYTVPAEVEADPVLNRQANELVALWCSAGATLAAPPAAFLVLLAARGDADLSLASLVILALYGFVLTCIGVYPFEKIKHLERDARQVR